MAPRWDGPPLTLRHVLAVHSEGRRWLRRREAFEALLVLLFVVTVAAFTPVLVDLWAACPGGMVDRRLIELVVFTLLWGVAPPLGILVVSLVLRGVARRLEVSRTYMFDVTGLTVAGPRAARAVPWSCVRRVRLPGWPRLTTVRIDTSSGTVQIPPYFLSESWPAGPQGGCLRHFGVRPDFDRRWRQSRRVQSRLVAAALETAGVRVAVGGRSGWDAMRRRLVLTCGALVVVLFTLGGLQRLGSIWRLRDLILQEMPTRSRAPEERLGRARALADAWTDSGESHAMLAFALLGVRGHEGEALAEARRAVELEPDLDDAHVALHSALLASRRGPTTESVREAFLAARVHLIVPRTMVVPELLAMGCLDAARFQLARVRPDRRRILPAELALLEGDADGVLFALPVESRRSCVQEALAASALRCQGRMTEAARACAFAEAQSGDESTVEGWEVAMLCSPVRPSPGRAHVRIVPVALFRRLRSASAP